MNSETYPGVSTLVGPFGLISVPSPHLTYPFTKGERVSIQGKRYEVVALKDDASGNQAFVYFSNEIKA